MGMAFALVLCMIISHAIHLSGIVEQIQIDRLQQQDLSLVVHLGNDIQQGCTDPAPAQSNQRRLQIMIVSTVLQLLGQLQSELLERVGIKCGAGNVAHDQDGFELDGSC